MTENEHHNKPKRDSVIRRGDIVRYKNTEYVGLPSGSNIFLFALGTPTEELQFKGNWVHNPKQSSVEKVQSYNTANTAAPAAAAAAAVEQHEDVLKLSATEEQLKFKCARDFNYPDSSAPECAEILECITCHAPAYEPVTCTACHYMFCSACMSDETACPNCSTTPVHTEIVRSMQILAPLAKLKVTCPKCNACIARRDLQAHVQTQCMKVRVRCIAAGSLCAWKGPREALAAHLPQCHHRAIAPQFEALTTKLADVCEKLTSVTDALARQERELNDLRMRLPATNGQMVE